MKRFEIKEITEKNIWEEFLLSRKPGTFLQSWYWGEVNQRIGYKINRLGFWENGKLSGLSLVIHQPAKRGPHLLIPGGPVIDFTNKALSDFVFKKIKEYAQKEGVWFVRLRPDVKDSSSIRDILREAGLNSAPMHVHGENTLILDITKDEEEILKGMRKNTRYLIKKSLKEDYFVSTNNNEEAADNLYKLQKETVKRHGFVGFKKNLFKAEIDVFSGENKALVFECRKGKELLSSAIIVFYADKAYYHFSASSLSSTKTNASYFLQWQIIKKAKSMNMKLYDFWGISSKENPKHRFWGVTVFKRGFGGERIDWIHAHDLIIKPVYWITYFFESLRRGIRHL